MICPRCSVAQLSPVTGVCELCGYSADSAVAVERADPTAELAQKQLAHEFTFGEILGRGAHSTIFRVKERGSGRSVILKVLARRTDEPDAEESFRGTLGAFSGFDHPHLVPIVRFGSTDSLFWYATADVEGHSLRSVLLRKDPMDLRSCRRMATQVVGALDFLHRRGVVHGAIKAENVMLDKDGWVRLCDPLFIRARPRRLSRGAPTPAPGQRRSEPVPIAPRLPWVAPEEHARGERTPASDQYALATLVFECLAGHPPASANEDLLTLRPDIPPHVARAVARGLGDDPLRRFVSCTDFLGALEEGSGWQPEQRSTGRVTEEVVLIKGWEPPADPGKRTTFLVRLAALVAIGGALAVAAPTIYGILSPPPAPAVSRPAAPVDAPPTVVTLPPVARAPEPTTSEPPRRETPRGETPAPRTTGRRSSSTRAQSSVPAGAAPAPVQAPTAAAAVISARLFVNSTPWGQVYVDGELVGNTPRGNIELTPGAHTLRVARTGFTPFERNLRLQPGDTLRLTSIVLEPARP